MKAVRHTGIVVSDVEKALHFYRDLLGLKIVKDILESGSFIDSILSLKAVSVRTIKMGADDGNLIELLYYHSHPTSPSAKKDIYEIGISHIAFTVEDLDTEYKKLSGAGIQFNTIPKVSVDGCAKVTFCRDPEGNLIELVEVLK